MSIALPDLKMIIESQTTRKLTDMASRLPLKKRGSWWYKKIDVVVSGKTYRVGGYIRQDPISGKLEIKIEN